MSEYTEIYSNATLMMLPLVNILFLIILVIIGIYRLQSRPNNINHWFNKLITWKKEIKIISNLHAETAIHKPVKILLIRNTIFGKIKCRYISKVPITPANYRWFGMVKFITMEQDKIKLHCTFITRPSIPPIDPSHLTITIDDHAKNSFYPTEIGFSESHPSISSIFDAIDTRQSIKTTLIRKFIKDRKTKFYLAYFKSEEELASYTLEKTYVISDEYGTIFIVAILAIFYDPLNNDEYTIKIYSYDSKQFEYIPVSQIIDIYAFNNHFEYGKPVFTDGDLRHSYSMKYLYRTDK